MGVWSFLNAPAFIIALGVGLMITYVTVPPPKVVIKFPTPFNAGKIVYAGSAPPEGLPQGSGAGGAAEAAAGYPGEGDECYKYRALEVDCDDYAGQVRPQPMTIGAASSIEGGVGIQLR